ncbi:hypothetical protein GCM10025861_27950 (plasmid) [Methanobacterium petrolearium]|nr:hypothetical protein GCM10025861_27950 [Methanobacterium petrolearium]
MVGCYAGSTKERIATFLTVKVTALLEELYPDQPAMLHTQTWNYPRLQYTKSWVTHLFLVRKISKKE